MVYDPGTLDTALAAAVGDDLALVADLRVAFLESARRHVSQLENAADADVWQLGAWRLKGLAASFGVTQLMQLADEAVLSAPANKKILRQIHICLALLERD